MDPLALWQSLGSDGLFERRQLLVPGQKRPRAHGTLGGVERPGRVVRFARLIQRPVRVLGVPSARAASGGNLSLTR